MVKAGTTVEQDQGRHLPHTRPIWWELRTLNVEEEFATAYIDSHRS